MDVEKLKKTVADILPEVDIVIGYGQGFDELHVEPYLVTKPDQIDKLVLNGLCAHNLASYLPSLKNKKVAVVVKGCDSRTVIQLLQEGLIKRENIKIIGVPCKGIASIKKVTKKIDHEPVVSVRCNENELVVKTAKGEMKVSLADVSPDKCKSCQYPTPLLHDVLLGDPIQSDKAPESVYDDIRELEGKSLEERKEYWEKEIGRCIRCYACRNACPMCVCQDNCIAETRDPHWMSQRTTLAEKTMFHLIHAMHLAGRCTECGECERVCPMEIPLGKLKKKINMDMKDLFNYVPGIDQEEKPPLSTFKVEEEKIEEHKLS